MACRRRSARCSAVSEVFCHGRSPADVEVEVVTKVSLLFDRYNREVSKVFDLVAWSDRNPGGSLVPASIG